MGAGERQGAYVPPKQPMFLCLLNSVGSHWPHHPLNPFATAILLVRISSPHFSVPHSSISVHSRSSVPFVFSCRAAQALHSHSASWPKIFSPSRYFPKVFFIRGILVSALKIIDLFKVNLSVASEQLGFLGLGSHPSWSYRSVS